MTVQGYLATAAAVLALSWVAVGLMRAANLGPSGAAVTVVVLFSLIAITPLCGILFDCGCDWPWLGLHRDCNYFAEHAKLKCPWCDSIVAGGLSMLAVFGSSAFVAYSACAKGVSALWGTASANARFTIGVLAGTTTFHVVSLAAAVLAALATGYPLPFTS